LSYMQNRPKIKEVWMNNTKYIVVNNDSILTEHMIIFPAMISHEAMALAMKLMLLPNVISAGFIDEFMQCYGESFTLKKQSRKDIDTLLLKTMLEIDDKALFFLS